MGQLREEHAHNVTPWTEGSRHGSHAGLARKFTDKMRRNEIAKLPQNNQLRCGWFGVSFYHLCRVTELKNHSNHFFSALTEEPMGRLCTEFFSLPSGFTKRITREINHLERAQQSMRLIGRRLQFHLGGQLHQEI
jgi:hypothetical protein